METVWGRFGDGMEAVCGTEAVWRRMGREKDVDKIYDSVYEISRGEGSPDESKLFDLKDPQHLSSTSYGRLKQTEILYIFLNGIYRG